MIVTDLFLLILLTAALGFGWLSGYLYARGTYDPTWTGDHHDE